MISKYTKPIIIGVLLLFIAAFILISLPITAVSGTLRFAIIAVTAGIALAAGAMHLFMYIFAVRERYLLIHAAFCLPVFINISILFTAGIATDEGTSPAAIQAASIITLMATLSAHALCLWFTHEILGLRQKDKTTRNIYIAALALPALMILIMGTAYAQVWSVLFGVPYIIIAVQTLTDKHYRKNHYVVTYICALSVYAILPIITMLPFTQNLIAPQIPSMLLILVMQTVLTAYSYGVIKRRDRLITADKERTKAEREITADIQKMLLPNPFFPFPGRDEVELFADIEPAADTGCDFYDYFFTDKYTLAVIIAGGSSGGVHGALFMSLAKTLIKSSARRGMSPGEIFENVNNLLCEDNREQIGITAFLGLLHVPRGRFTYANAGHYSPLVSRGENVVKMSESENSMLAVTKNARFRQDEIMLQAGDGLFLYTDGVFSAENKEGEPFGEYRMIETVSRYMASGMSPMNLIQSIKRDIEDYTEGVPHSGDITMLSLKIVR